MSSIDQTSQVAFREVVKSAQRLLTARVLHDRDQAGLTEEEILSRADALKEVVEEFIDACTEGFSEE